MKLTEAALAEKEVIKNLMQYYFYDFSEFIDTAVMTKGKFGEYPYLDNYWEEPARYPFLLTSEGEYAGFVLVRYIEEGDTYYYSIAEFFIMKKFRRKGLGREAAFKIFDRFKGCWEVSQIKRNGPANIFWRKTINEYTGGDWVERETDGHFAQLFSS
ncbi:GNAT family N-acetyltransferase [Bacillus sp. SG-1]|uniref:GNAT family N-acetyltransferase n=1 Tax=Bacillus sp. SG-1 TaxID=161544 RepID=UPI00031156F3|nr:GNAT family N-acetyltransferase [Bacillus sp. SG-1]